MRMSAQTSREEEEEMAEEKEEAGARQVKKATNDKNNKKNVNKMKFCPHQTGRQQSITCDTAKDHTLQNIQQKEKKSQLKTPVNTLFYHILFYHLLALLNF